MNKLIFIALTLTVFLFNNCDQMPARPGSESSSSSLPPGHVSIDGGNGAIVPLSETKTASVVSANRTLDTIVSCLGTGTANQRAKDEFEKNKGSISVDGSANSLTQPMLTALAMVGGEVCSDLIGKERALAAAQRRIFPQVNFGAGPASVNRTIEADVIRRLARSCWGRNETETELLAIQDAVEAAFAGVAAGNNNVGTVNKMIYLCSAMVASFATYEM